MLAYEGPVRAPADGYGAPGPHAVVIERLPSPRWAGQPVTVFRPAGDPRPLPTWFFAHGFGGNDASFYQELLHHLASHGFVVVFSPYPTQLLQVAANYEIMFAGFMAAVDRYPGWIDVSRVGFAGHSYGGGAVPALALRGLREQGWGQEGLALLILAPWYSYGLGEADLQTFPPHTQALVQIYEDDLVNDHRMAIDLFTQLSLSDANKDFLVVRSDRIAGYNFVAGHHVPTGANVPRAAAALDALDVWAVHRLATALGASALYGDAAARAVSLGDGNAEQTFMGEAAGERPLRPMTQWDHPLPLYPQGRYWQPFQSPLNPRRSVAPPAIASKPHLVNLAARARTAAGDRVLIAGAIVRGEQPKSLLVRGAGPALRSYNIANPVADPRLDLFRGGVADLAIDDWSQAIELDVLRIAAEETGAFPFPDESADAALLASFAHGSLSVHLASREEEGGVALLEIYAADQNPGAQLVNLSARAFVGTGEDILIGGFIIKGSGSLRVLLRGLGPALARAGVIEPLRNPEIVLHNTSGEAIAANNDWSSDPLQATQLTSAMGRAGAAPLPMGSLDAALLIDLPAGAYTAHLRSAEGAAGVGLLEIFIVDP